MQHRPHICKVDPDQIHARQQVGDRPHRLCHIIQALIMLFGTVRYARFLGLPS